MTEKKKNRVKAKIKKTEAVDNLEGVIYLTTSWKGMPNYECLWCQFATVDHDNALDHYKAEHTQRPIEGRIVNTGLVTSDGAPITRVEPAEEA
jgi:hypothetical protein